jgi:hypothetical protein
VEVREANLGLFSCHFAGSHATSLDWVWEGQALAVPLDSGMMGALAPEGWGPSHTGIGPGLPPSDTFVVPDRGDTTSCTETR